MDAEKAYQLSLVSSSETTFPTGSSSSALPANSIPNDPASSSKIPVYNHHFAVTEQRCSPSSGQNRKKALSRSATPSSTGTGPTALHSKIGPSKATTGDVYEFHSSPEENNEEPSNGSNLSNSIPTVTVIHPKSASISSIQSLALECQQPPQKRIKTAILAKKLLAAAADSNIIDPSGLTFSSGDPEKADQWTNEFDGQKDENEDEEGDGEIENEEEELEERGIGAGEETEECLQIQRGRAYSSTSVLVQEQKKVPPLRISLLKTPSEEGTESGAQISPTTVLKFRHRGGGRRQGHGLEKDDLQRITRSRVRQNATGASIDGASNSGRKRRYRTNAVDEVCLPEEEDTMSSNAEGTAEEGVVEGEGSAEKGEDAGGGRSEERKGEEKAQKAEAERIAKAEEEKATTQRNSQSKMRFCQFFLSKNSFEQSVAFETMVRERWKSHYKEHLELIAERMENANLNNSQQKPAHETEIYHFLEYNARKDWPDSLQKLYIEQARRSQEMTETHQMERERIQQMAAKEFERAAEAQRKSQEGVKQRQFLTVVSMLRDSECYDPGLFCEEATVPQNVQRIPLLSQITQRFIYLANTTKNRHTMEAHTLAETNKAEWKRALKKIVRQNERQQMLKGSTKELQLPAECCNAIVSTVKVFDIPIGNSKLN